MSKESEPIFCLDLHQQYEGSLPAFKPFLTISADFAKYCESPLVVSVTWNGEYAETSESLEALSPRLFTGSGTEIGSNPKRDASFVCKNRESAARLIGKIEKWYVKEKRKLSNFKIEMFPEL
jgi:hypothetical protein